MLGVVAASILAIHFQISKSIDEAAIEENSAVPDVKVAQHETMEDDEISFANETILINTTTVANCLSLKHDLEPFNLLMALVEANYAVADFTSLNIEEIKNCLTLLETFHQRVTAAAPSRAVQRPCRGRLSHPLQIIHLDRLFHSPPPPQRRPDLSPGLHQPHCHSAVHFRSEHQRLPAVERVGRQAVQTNEKPDAQVIRGGSRHGLDGGCTVTGC